MKSLRRIGSDVAPPHGDEMIETAVEKRRLGQHRNGRGAGAFVAARDRCRIVVRLQHAPRRRTALALGDHVDAIRPARARALNASRSRLDARPRAGPSRRAAPLGSRRSTIRRVAATMAASRSGDCTVDVMTRPPCLARFDAATMASSVARAAPESMAVRRPRRCHRAPTPPCRPTNNEAPAFSSTTSRRGPFSPARISAHDRGVGRRIATLQVAAGRPSGSPKSDGCT